ncbi:hypothetical protein H5410_055910 [Solanum commersonii]|uniref:Ubiquitin-like protease family profile domain-containing protein n=1 Tax=Solanum commersonii TaxID=4109 RepID=A0A9J5WL72_SOLCO|nr:hypothetical protein H5410_055910 [Solanum commersonii]
MVQHIDVVFYYLRKKLKLRIPNQYRCTIVNCKHIARGAVVFAFERSIKNIIKEFSIRTGLSWHLIDDVYISINSDGKFHWVLVVVALKKRLIRVYDSSLSTRIKAPSKLTDWSSLDAYKDKQTGMILGPQHNFEFELVQDIMQQESDSLDCEMFVAAFAEFLGDEIPIPKIGFHSEYLCTRYAALLRKYSTEKAKAGYVSENDDPTRSKSHFTTLAQEDLVNFE